MSNSTYNIDPNIISEVLKSAGSCSIREAQFYNGNFFKIDIEHGGIFRFIPDENTTGILYQFMSKGLQPVKVYLAEMFPEYVLIQNDIFGHVVKVTVKYSEMQFLD